VSSLVPSYQGSTFSSRWFLGSLIVHGICLILILLLFRPAAPVDQADAPTSPKNVTSAQRLNDLSEKVRELQTRQLNETVSSLEETLESIEQLESDATDQLREAYPGETDAADQNLESDREKALAAQRRALDNIQAAIEASAESAIDSDFEIARVAAMEDQAEAENALAQVASARVLARQSNDALEPLIELQLAASQALAASRAKDKEVTEAQKLIRQQEKALSNHRRVIERREAEIKKMQAELETKQKAFQKANQDIDDSKVNVGEKKNDVSLAQTANQTAIKVLDDARAATRAAQQSYQKIQNSGDKPQVVKAQKEVMSSRQNEKARLNEQRKSDRQLNQAKHQVKVAEHGIDVAKHKANTAQNQIEFIKSRIGRAQSHIAKQQAKADPHELVLTTQAARIKSLQGNNIQELVDAKKAQQQAMAANQSFDPMQAATNNAALAASTTKATFQRARALERQIAIKFKEIRSAELALMQKMKPSEARQLVSVALPERAALDVTALDQTVRSQDALKHKIDTLNLANQQAQTMDEFTKTLLAQAMGLKKRGVEITLVQRQAVAAAEKSQSAEDDGGAIRDMTALMAKRQQQASTAGKLADSPASDSKSSKKYTIVDDPVVPPAPPTNMARSGPARRFSADAGAPTKGWTFVDSWYLLGPFDNPDRRNIHKQFPPDSLVDLDATYRSSASSTPIQWNFYQGTEPKIEPRHLQGEYVIFYATTEIYFEQATDVWIAVGSDDRSDLWINDVRVWSSSDILKAWRIDEGMRRVRFEAGRNKVLYRIENGNGPWAFSLCINLDNQVPAS
jgi:hypothetical protein